MISVILQKVVITSTNHNFAYFCDYIIVSKVSGKYVFSANNPKASLLHFPFWLILNSFRFFSKTKIHKKQKMFLTSDAHNVTFEK